ncbi:putative reverse transcriptase domain-containing protein [Tanacetum coccineum]
MRGQRGLLDSQDQRARIPDHRRFLGVADSAALTWWNGQIRTLGPEAYAMTWEVLKKKMTDKYCPQGEIKKLEIELWNLKVKGNDVPTYTERFQELTLICTKFVANETEKVDKYLSKSDNKRKADDSSRNNHGHQQQPFKRQNVAKVYNMGTGERKPYGGSSASATKLPSPPQWPVHPEVPQVQQDGHFARDCRNTGNTNVANTQKGNGATPREGCFGVEHRDTSRERLPKMRKWRKWERYAHRMGLCSWDMQKRGKCTGNLMQMSYMAKGCQVFLAQISAKKEEDKSERKQIEDVPIVRDFPEVFPEDLPGLPPARPVEFQIDLVPGAAPVARAPYDCPVPK